MICADRLAVRQQVPAKMLKELLAHDRKSRIAKIRVPLLATSGAKDIQCLPCDADLIKELALGEFEKHYLNVLSHILRSDTAPASFERYNYLMEKAIDPRVPLLCLDWILKQSFE